ncbi:MAG: MBL fold metallo-hydrolase [Sulfurospirillaceae bacterium]|nr:MBL fold metallo-hydrolase [Sulfurospirillaceae bacterium]
MKKSILVLVLPIFLFANFFDFKPLKITKDISCFIGDFNPPLKSNKGFVSNVCYVDMGKFLVLLDAGATYNFAKELDAFIEKSTNKKIKYVVITNYHDDRLLGASYFKAKGVKIIAASNVPELIKKHKDSYDRILKHQPKDLLKGTKIVNPDILVDTKYEIKGDKKSLFVLKPSKATQSPADILVYSPNDSFIFAGNTIFNGRFINYASNSSMDGWIKALNFIKNKKAKYVMGGHGREYDKNSYKLTLDYLLMLKKQVKIAYDKDIDPADLDKNIHTDIYKNIPHYDELHIRNARNYFDQLEWQ